VYVKAPLAGVSVPFDGLAAEPTVVMMAMVAEIRIIAASRTFVRDIEVINERTGLILSGIFEILLSVPCAAPITVRKWKDGFVD
jgi:hypothetical protein